MKRQKSHLHSQLLYSLLFIGIAFPLWPQATPTPPCIPCPIEVSGQVFNPAGDPTYATKIMLSNGTHALNTLTDATGNYRMAANLCLAGNYTLSISAVGYVTRSTSLSLGCGTVVSDTSTLSIPTPILSPTAVPTPSPACTTACDGKVEGYIYDTAGSIFSGATVSFNDQRNIRKIVTTADGYYSFITYWCPIRWQSLSVTADGKQTHTITLYPRDCNSSRYDFYLVPASVTSRRGDVNSDGIINIVDALMIAQYVVGIGGLNNTAAGDTNCDGSITIVDALIAAQYYVGLISAMPC